MKYTSKLVRREIVDLHHFEEGDTTSEREKETEPINSYANITTA